MFTSPYTYHVLLPASTATFCFVCSTCDAAMDLLSAHATRLAPEQARLAPTAPRCVATGAWDKWLADHDVAVLAAWCHLLLVPTSVRKVSLVQYWARCRRWRSCYRRLMHRAHALADSHNPAPCVGPTAPAWCRTRLCRVCIRTRSQPIGTAVALLWHQRQHPMCCRCTTVARQRFPVASTLSLRCLEASTGRPPGVG